MLKLILSGLILFSTLGILVARELLIQLGMEPNHIYVAVGALTITLLLVYRGALLLLLVGVLTVGVNMPESALLNYGVDKDVLMAVLLVMILLPLVYRVVHD